MHNTNISKHPSYFNSSKWQLAMVVCTTLLCSSISAQEGLGLGAGLNEKIKIEYREAPLVDVLRHIGEAAKVNVAIAPAVAALNGKVTLSLVDVTYDVSLKTILDMFSLGAILDNGVLKIETLDNITKARDLKSAERQQRWKNEPTRPMVWQVKYAKAADLMGILGTFLKKYGQAGQVNVQADPRTNRIIVEGVPDALSRAKAILESLDKEKRQVLIEARVVEASNDLSKTLSITWGTRFGFDAQRGLATGLPFPNSFAGHIGGAGALGQAAPAPGTSVLPSQVGSMGFSLGSINGMINIDGILRAYETESLANIVAEPRLVVQDQDTAVIDEASVGSRIVVVNNAPVDKSFESKLKLEVKPQIISDKTLELEINVQRDTPLTAPTDPVAAKTARSAKTKLLVANGHTAVIGGLFQTKRTKGQGRIPFLGSLPLIGFLFRTNDEQTVRSELMILVTPRILPSIESTASEGFLPMGSATSAIPLSANPAMNNGGFSNAPPPVNSANGNLTMNGNNGAMPPVNNGATPPVNNGAMPPINNGTMPPANNLGAPNEEPELGAEPANTVPPPNGGNNFSL